MEEICILFFTANTCMALTSPPSLFALTVPPSVISDDEEIRNFADGQVHCKRGGKAENTRKNH